MVQVDPIKPTSKASGSERLRLKCDEPLSKIAFKFNLRRYNLEPRVINSIQNSDYRNLVGWCNSKHVLKLETAWCQREMKRGRGPGRGWQL